MLTALLGCKPGVAPEAQHSWRCSLTTVTKKVEGMPQPLRCVSPPTMFWIREYAIGVTPSSQVTGKQAKGRRGRLGLSRALQCGKGAVAARAAQAPYHPLLPRCSTTHHGPRRVLSPTPCTPPAHGPMQHVEVKPGLTGDELRDLGVRQRGRPGRHWAGRQVGGGAGVGCRKEAAAPGLLGVWG